MTPAARVLHVRAPDPEDPSEPVSSSYVKHVPKHRKPAGRRTPKAALHRSLRLSSMAVMATGIAVGGGTLALAGSEAPSTAAPATTALASGVLTRTSSASATTGSTTDQPAAQPSLPASRPARSEIVSRSSDRRAATDPLKQDALSLGQGNTLARSENLTGGDPRTIARALLSKFGWSESQFSCLDSLWTRESNWNLHAANPSGAYGIPQSLPGSKMASAGPDWQDNAVTQITWGLGYIQERYGSPCGAWAHSEGHGWY